MRRITGWRRDVLFLSICVSISFGVAAGFSFTLSQLAVKCVA